jgi:hypothetical protein
MKKPLPCTVCFLVDDIPFNAMWEDDKCWNPDVLRGKTIEQGRFACNNQHRSEKVLELRFR